MVSVLYFVTFILGFLPTGVSDIFYRLKWLMSYLYVRFCKYLKRKRLDLYDLSAKGQPEKVGFITPPEEFQLESPFPDSHLLKADDKIFCYGVNSKSECLVVSISRQCNQRAEANVYLKLANGKAYQLADNSDFQQCGNEKNAFTCGGLQMHYLCPMRRWRIFFSGFLKETTEGEGDSRMVFVKFSLLWIASSDIYDNTSDINEATVVESLAQEEWNTVLPPLSKLDSALDFYAQSGVILGTVCVDDALEDYELYLFGERIRYLGDSMASKEMEFSHMLGYVHKNGAYIHIGDASIKNVAKNVKFGFMVKPTAELKKIETFDISEGNSLSKASVTQFKGTIKVGRSYAICGSILHPIIQAGSGEKSISIEQIKFFLDGRRGTGFLIKGKYNVTSKRRISDIATPGKIPELLFPMVVSFTEDLCQVPEITGGKGSSLGKLTHLSNELQTFVVPRGMVVTTNSYKEFISKNILAEIQNLENVLYGNAAGDVKEVSKRVCDRIVGERIPNNIRDNILKNLKKIFGEKCIAKKFAVRSSATGEDTEQMSAAGQMDTFLGISGLDKILLAVKKCWASQFGFTAIQYKRRYGQCLNSPMAVVIQEMAECDVAGVIFTCNPVTGNPTTISIAANFGLGESVVSGSEEPDTIELKRNVNDDLILHNVTIGSKSHKITARDGRIRLEDIAEEKRQECCLSEENALKLGQLAVKIEKFYRSRRDIEWGMLNNVIHIFQSRPVTSGTQETDFEIEHEFDGALRVENDYYSVSNAGEVLPGALTTLAMDTFFKFFTVAWQNEEYLQWMIPFKPRYFRVGWMAMYNHAMFNVADIFQGGDPDNINPLDKATMVAFFGRVLHEKEIFDIAKERHSYDPKKFSLKDIYRMMKCLFLSGRRLKRAQKQYANYRIPVEKYKTSKVLFDFLLKSCTDVGPAGMSHMICTQGSLMWNMAILTTLSEAEGDVDIDVYTDFSSLVTSKSNVESADVPSAIQALASHIAKSIEPRVFKAMKVEEALRWLSSTPSSAGEKFRDFIKKHGHRCLMEFDMYSTPWGDDPKSLVPLLQNMAGNILEDTAHKQNASIIKLISQLKVPVKFLSKLKLMFYIPMSQTAVQHREASKSLMIKSIDAWRKGYRRLSKMMVAEGRIPEEDLLFFMTIEDVQELLNTRCPKIIAKAHHRQRLYPKMNKYMFPEMMKGFPRPLNLSAENTVPEEGYFSMKGIPVSQGIAKGYVRVAVSLEDAAELKPGEILLAYSTDIGWTPYFPNLAGVATELGGLISHGAVVSREYGLPCIVGLHGATRRFKTGDYVSLDGNKGILQKLPEPEEK